MTTVATLVLSLSVAATGGLFHRPAGANTICPGGRILPPGPGYGWGFPNGNPDGYGWVDYGTALPIGGDRTPDYYFPRYLSVPPAQAFFPTYYNPYVMRGQRYVPYTACGGKHPAGGPPPASSDTPQHPYAVGARTQPVVQPPVFHGRVEAAPIPSGSSGLIP
jgi:hypothetical protein